MDSCHICTLKTNQIRRVVKNLIHMINKITPFNIRSFKDHSQENPFAKVLNNFLKGNMPNSQATLKCKHHKELKQKIIEYLDLDEGQILKRCQIILMSQIKTNYTLDTISLQMRLMPFRFPFGAEMLKKAKQSINKQKKSRFEENDQSNEDQMGQIRKRRQDQGQNEKQIHYVNDKEQINVQAIQIETGKQLEENVS